MAKSKGRGGRKNATQSGETFRSAPVPLAPHDVPPPATEASQDPKVMRCPRCHCTDLRVYYTRRRPLHIMRVRRCRHCGKQITTWEKQVG